MEIVEERYGRGSTMITSQLPIKAWHDVISEPTFADAILDRIVHYAYRLDLEGLRRDNQVEIRIAASKNLPERSCRCLNRMFPGVLTPVEPRFGRLLMAVWRLKLPNCATRQTAISVCASPLTPNTNDLANSALQIFTRRCTVRSNMSG